VPALPSSHTWGLPHRVRDTAIVRPQARASSPGRTTCRSNPSTLHDEEPPKGTPSDGGGAIRRAAVAPRRQYRSRDK
jgi:hypothetical protein